MEELISLFVNNGVAVAVIIYFCWRDMKYMQTLQTTLVQLQDTCSLMKEILLMKEGDKNGRDE